MTTNSVFQKDPSILICLIVCSLGIPYMMFRRLTNRLSRDKKQEEINGNGHANGRDPVDAKGTPYAPQSTTHEVEDHSANRREVESSFEKYAQLIHASRNPLPTQSGDGAYAYDHTVPSGLLQDIKSMGFKDIGTLMAVMKNKASGELQDDKTYMMEHVIQASYTSDHCYATMITFTPSLPAGYPQCRKPGLT